MSVLIIAGGDPNFTRNKVIKKVLKRNYLSSILVKQYVDCDFIVLGFVNILQNRRTPLHIAASRGYTKIVSQLIEAGGDPNNASKVMSNIYCMSSNHFILLLYIIYIYI